MNKTSALTVQFPTIKTNAEIEIMREGAKIWKKIRKEITPMVQIGTTGFEIEEKIHKLFQEHKVIPAFQNYNKFPGLICISINDCIVHGLRNNYKLCSGDKITLDIGFIHKRLYIDSAFTLLVDAKNHPDYQKIIDFGLQALWAGINAAGPNIHTGNITFAIENYVKKKVDPQYKILDNFTGHGIGHKLHETPHIFNKGLKNGEGVKLPPNSVICIEPMLIQQENGACKIGDNGFDVVSNIPNSQTVHWEHMVLIKKQGIEVLTAEENELKQYYGS